LGVGRFVTAAALSAAVLTAAAMAAASSAWAVARTVSAARLRE
jgi:hypothetical protein